MQTAKLFSRKKDENVVAGQKFAKFSRGFCCIGNSAIRPNPLVHMGPSFEKTSEKCTLHYPGEYLKLGELTNFDRFLKSER